MKAFLHLLWIVSLLSSLNLLQAKDCPQEGNDPFRYKAIEELEFTSDQANIDLTLTDAAPEGEPAAEDPEDKPKRVALFKFEKDYNPKNVLEYGINVHPKTCRIAKTGNGAPAFNTFWIMGEEDGRRKQMTSDDRQRMGPIVLANETNKVVFKMNAFKEVPLKKKEITIEAKMVDGQCRVKGYVTLNDGREMNLDKIWAKLSYFFGVPTGVNYLQVYGQDRSSGQKFNFKLED